MILKLKERDALYALPKFNSVADNYHLLKLKKKVLVKPAERKAILQPIAEAGELFMVNGERVWDDDVETGVEIDLSEHDEYLRNILYVLSENQQLSADLTNLYFHYHPEDLTEIQGGGNTERPKPKSTKK